MVYNAGIFMYTDASSALMCSRNQRRVPVLLLACIFIVVHLDFIAYCYTMHHDVHVHVLYGNLAIVIILYYRCRTMIKVHVYLWHFESIVRYFVGTAMVLYISGITKSMLE